MRASPSFTSAALSDSYELLPPLVHLRLHRIDLQHPGVVEEAWVSFLGISRVASKVMHVSLLASSMFFIDGSFVSACKCSRQRQPVSRHVNCGFCCHFRHQMARFLARIGHPCYPHSHLLPATIACGRCAPGPQRFRFRPWKQTERPSDAGWP